MKTPFYNVLAVLACAYLLAANTWGWSLWQRSANQSALQSTSYRYRSSYYGSSSSGGWFSGGGSHK